MFGKQKKRIAAIVESERLVETPESRGPGHFVAATQRGGTEVMVEIRPQQLYRSGMPVDRSPQRVFRRFGLARDANLVVLLPGGHTASPELPRGPQVATGDAAFDARFEVVSVDEGDVARVLAPDIRRRLLELDDVAELRIHDGGASLHLSFARLDPGPIRAGLDLVAALDIV